MSVYDNYRCEGQMSLFDSLETLPEEEMVARVAEASGLEFKKDDLWGWVFRKKGCKLHVNYSRYSFGDEYRFISCGISTKDGGASGPCDSIDEAIRAVNRYKERMK